MLLYIYLVQANLCICWCIYKDIKFPETIWDFIKLTLIPYHIYCWYRGKEL